MRSTAPRRTRFLDACRSLAADNSVRVVVISGAGRAFMAGGDLTELRADPTGTAQALIGPMHEALLLLTQMRAPVVASLHGAVAGAGLSLALACDLALAAEGTRFTLAYVEQVGPTAMYREIVVIAAGLAQGRRCAARRYRCRGVQTGYCRPRSVSSRTELPQHRFRNGLHEDQEKRWLK